MQSLSFFVFTRSLSLPAVVLLLGCGGSVAPTSEPPTDSGTTETGAPVEWKDTASCDAIRASCGGEPAVVVRGMSKGLTGLDGARVEFAVRYILEEGMGLDVPHGVALGRTHVKDASFETCVCVPHGANMYPQIAAVVYAPGSTSLASRDVARASFSQRYATLGDEDVSYALAAAPNALQKEAAVAAMVDRTEKVLLGFLTGEERGIYAGIIADERPLAPQLATGSAGFGAATLSWTMPGRLVANERVAFFVDNNNNGKCDLDGTDQGAITPFSKTLPEPAKWLSGDGLRVVCDALQVGASRE